MENSNFRLFTANRKQKQHTSICFLRTENRSFFLWSANVKWLSTFCPANVPIYATVGAKIIVASAENCRFLKFCYLSHTGDREV